MQHFPVVQVILRILWLFKLTRNWYDVDHLMVKVSGMKLKDLKSDELQRLNKARSEQVNPYLKRVKINQEQMNYRTSK